MINLTAIVVPYTGGGIDISSLPIFGVTILIVVILLLMALLGVLLYTMNKDEFCEKSLGIEYKVMTIIVDILTLIVGFGGGSWLIYECISEIINRA